jgi:hypothetical protein
MRNYVKKPWSIRERELLRDNYYLASKEELLQMLPGRTLTSIQSQVHYLRKRGWYFKRETVI